MPHIRSSLEEAYARLTAMKLYAYRALDYVQAATTADRRYLLYCAVQKAKVSTEGVKVVAQLAQCIGAKAFDGHTYFEMAMRDVQLIPPLEGSTHINLGLTARFMARYFERADDNLAAPPSFADRQSSAGENAYLYEAHGSAINSIAFAHFLKAYRPLAAIPNVRIFARQAKAFQLFGRKQHDRARRAATEETTSTHTQAELLSGQCLACIAYGQLIAECAVHVDLAPQLTSVIFHLLIHDLSTTAATLASLPQWSRPARASLQRIAALPRTTAEDWEYISGLLAAQ
jgi:acyl-CoA dehydrogenase